MNQVWEILGIVVAVLMVAIGLRLLLKKPQPEQPIAQEELLVEAQSQQPIVPRHLRQAPEQVTSSIPPQAETVADPVPVEPVREHTASVPDEDVLTNQDTVKTVQENSVKETQKDELDELLEQLKDEQELVHEAGQKVPETEVENYTGQESKQQVDEKTASITEIETVEIQEWQGDSDVLDAHLSEQDRNDEESALATAEQLVALYMYPNPVRALSGERTLKMMLKYGLRFGEMSCFHRYEHPEHTSPLMFSVLRINDDGTPTGFDLETLPNEEVKGLAFFLALPNPNAIQGFDMMASIAGLIARDTEGLVFDEQSLELTPQLRDHWRHFVIEYRPTGE